MEQLKYDAIVVGAGLTGLTVAYQLSKQGKKVLVLEKRERVGGQILTKESDGYIYETGPNTGMIASPEVAELLENLSDTCMLDIACSSAKKRLIWKNGKFYALPSGLMSAVKTPLFTLYDKIRILGEPFRKKGTNPNESIADMTKRRLGKSFFEYAVDPFVSGVYAGNPHQLVTQYALPKLYRLEHEYGSFVKGAIALRKQPKSDRDKKATKEVFSMEGGLSSLIKALAEKVGNECIVLQADAVTLQPMDKGWMVTYMNQEDEKIHLTTENVIPTAPAYQLPALMPFLSEDEAERLASLTYASLIQVSIGLNSQHPASYLAFGGLIPTKEKEDVLGVLFPFACFKGRTPKDKALYSIFIGGIQRPEMMEKSDEELKDIAVDALHRMLGYNIQSDDLELCAITRHNKVIPQYDKTCGDRWELICQLEKRYSGLFIGGNIKDGIGMADRIKQGVDIALRCVNAHE